MFVPVHVTILVKQDRCKCRRQVAVLFRKQHASVLASSECTLNRLHVRRGRVGGAEPLDQPLADEDGRVLVHEQLIQQTCHFCKRCCLCFPALLPLQEDRRVSEGRATGDLNGVVHVLVVLAADLEDGILAHRGGVVAGVAEDLHIAAAHVASSVGLVRTNGQSVNAVLLAWDLAEDSARFDGDAVKSGCRSSALPHHCKVVGLRA
mmetsp:Transcript_62859/g.117555  ORF Transcript_62859/g.117555 Transcript_62859/m.117555 type:complete len:206 (-) Transcript_62859:452-1069(-)